MSIESIAIHTHLDIDTTLCGKVTRFKEGYAEVLLHTTRQMVADSKGLVHGGFIFGAADYAAMAAVNDPHVVLGAASSRFIAPVRVGDAVLFSATVVSEKGKKREVSVEAVVSGVRVFEGTFTTFVLEKHILG